MKDIIQWIFICLFMWLMGTILLVEGAMGIAVWFYGLMDFIEALYTGDLRMWWYITPWIIVGLITRI